MGIIASQTFTAQLKAGQEYREVVAGTNEIGEIRLMERDSMTISVKFGKELKSERHFLSYIRVLLPRLIYMMPFPPGRGKTLRTVVDSFVTGIRHIHPPLNPPKSRVRPYRGMDAQISPVKRRCCGFFYFPHAFWTRPFFPVVTPISLPNARWKRCNALTRCLLLLLWMSWTGNFRTWWG
jgi:hypothetical protein